MFQSEYSCFQVDNVSKFTSTISVTESKILIPCISGLKWYHTRCSYRSRSIQSRFNRRRFLSSRNFSRRKSLKLFWFTIDAKVECREIKKIFIYKFELSFFTEKCKNDNESEFLNFSLKIHHRNAHFWNFRKSYQRVNWLKSGDSPKRAFSLKIEN